MITILYAILRDENLPHLIANFTDQGVTDSILGTLTDSDLKELGIQKLGERKRLLVAFKNAELALRAGIGAGAMVMIAGGALPDGSELAGQMVADFSIGRTVVTCGQWKAVRDWAATKGYDLAGVGGTDPQDGGDGLPVVNVSWYDVVKWCNARSEKEGKTAVYQANGGVYRSGEFGDRGSTAVTMKSGANGYRLPLEAEWEWAAMANGYRLPWEWAAMGADDDATLGRVSSKGHNYSPSSLYELGDVWEWVWDLHVESSGRGIRGGGWNSGAYYAEAVYRGYNDYPGNRFDRYGFRVAFSSVR